MKVLRTPDERFNGLPDFPYEPNYLVVADGEGGRLRIHYVDEGPKDAEPVLMMHGEPSWSFLYRKMIPIFLGAGNRAVAPDLVGFGRSDKPADRSDYTYNRHVGWMQAWLEQADLKRITLVCQDWGGLIGLRLLAALPERFARAVVANTGLPTGDFPISEAFLQWRTFSVEVPEFNVGAIINMGTLSDLPEEILGAYNAPFPDETLQGRGPHFSFPGAHCSGRSGGPGQPPGLGGPVQVRKAVSDRFQRRRSHHPRRREDLSEEGARRPGSAAHGCSRRLVTSSRKTGAKRLPGWFRTS